MKASGVVLLVALAVFIVVQPVSGELTSMVSDPVGDAFPTAQPFQDIVAASVTLADGTFTLTMELSVALPEQPTLVPPGVAEIWWRWSLNTDPNTVPIGFPFIAMTPKAPAEFMAVVKSDGKEYTAFLIDRRPLHIGGDEIITPLSFGIEGAHVTASVDADLLGNPAFFFWRAITTDWAHSPPSEGFFDVDLTAINATWP